MVHDCRLPAPMSMARAAPTAPPVALRQPCQRCSCSLSRLCADCCRARWAGSGFWMSRPVRVCSPAEASLPQDARSGPGLDKGPFSSPSPQLWHTCLWGSIVALLTPPPKQPGPRVMPRAESRNLSAESPAARGPFPRAAGQMPVRESVAFCGAGVDALGARGFLCLGSGQPRGRPQGCGVAVPALAPMWSQPGSMACRLHLVLRVSGRVSRTKCSPETC